MSEMLDGAVMDDAGVDLNEVLGGETAETEITEETPVETTDDTEVADGDVVAEENEAQEQNNEEQAQEEEKWDGRTIPAKLRSVLKSIQGTDPKSAGELKDTWFTAQNFRQVFSSPKEAAKFKADVEALGGFEAITAERAEWAQINSLLAAGDPALIDNIAKTNPEAISKLAPKVLESLAQSDPDTYTREMSAVLANTFGQRGGLIDVLTAVQNALKAGDAAAALQNIEALGKWALGFESAAKAAPKAKSIDPERQKFEHEKAAFAQQRVTAFNDSLGKQYESANRAAVQKELANYLKGRSLDDTALNMVMNNVMVEIGVLLNQDQSFKSQLAKFQKSFDQDGANKLLRSRTDKLIPQAVKKIYSSFAGVSGVQLKTVKQTANISQKAQANGKTAATRATPGFTKVNQMPGPNQINRNLTTKEMIMNNQAVLVNGKKVTWD